MKLIPSRILRFTSVSTVLATLAILFLRGRDPSFLHFHRTAAAERAVAHVIGHVEFRRTPFHQAVEELCRTAGVAVACGQDVRGDGAYYAPVNLIADQLTLEEALRQLTFETKSAISFLPEGDAVRLVEADSPHQPFCFDRYAADVASDPAVLLRPLPWDATSVKTVIYYTGGARIVDPAPNSLGFMLAPQRWPMAEFALPSDPSHVWILQSASAQRQWHSALAALRRQAPADERRLLPVGTQIFDYADGAFRPRNRSIAQEKLAASFTFTAIAPQPLVGALRDLSQQAGVEIFPSNHSYFDAAQVSLPARQTTLAGALEALLTQNGDEPRWIVPDDRAIRCGVASSLRIYDLENYLAQWPASARPNRLAPLINALPFDHGRPTYTDISETAVYRESMLIIDAPWRDQEAVAARLTQAMHDEAAAGKLAKIP